VSTVKELYERTKQLHQFLEEPLPKEDREPYIEKLELLLQRRAELISRFKQPVRLQEQEMAQEIVDWNKQIEQRLKMYLAVIKTDMNKLEQQKQTNKKYENPYDTQPDGFFIDKKN
jgi:flagellar protein FliT